MADNRNRFSIFKRLNRQSDEILYGTTKEDEKRIERIDEINNKIKELNVNHKSLYKTDNVLEFLTQSQLINLDRLQTRINKVNLQNKISSDSKRVFEEILQNENIRNIFDAEKNRIETYSDYRIVDAYIPQISRTIDLFRDSILAPDDITKNSIDILYDKDMDEDFNETFNEKVKLYKKKTNIDSKAKQWIREGLVDGDKFVAILKIDNELNKMLLNENYVGHNIKILTEDELIDNKELSILNNLFFEDVMDNIKNTKEYKDLSRDNKEKTIKSVKNDITKEIVKRFNNNIECVSGKDKFKRFYDSNMYDDKTKIDKPIKLDGCIIKSLEPEKVCKLESRDEICFGYLYIEQYDVNSTDISTGFGSSVGDLMNVGNTNQYTSTTSSISQSSFGDGTTSTVTSMVNSAGNDYFNSFKSDGRGCTTIKEKFLTDLFVKGISKKLDKKIIESNPQFKEMIYSLVRQDYIVNKKIRITYFSPEEVEHYKPDSNNTYGISKLAKILFYAKMFLSTMITESMQKISRGRDKRVIYVETGIDDDIEDSINEVIREFKSKEIQSDVLKSITSVLRRIGSFEDYFLPKIDGEVPIDFETISGMDVNVDDDWNQFLLKSMITGMGLPNTYIDESNNTDFSRSLLMQNTTFVRDIVSDQGDAQTFLTNVVQKSFNYMYYSEIQSNVINKKDDDKKSSKKSNKDDDLKLLDIDINKVIVKLPTPAYLDVANTNEQIQNYQTKIEFIVNTFYDENSSDEAIAVEKYEFKKEVTKDMVTSIDWNKYEQIQEKVKKKINQMQLEKESQENGNSSGGGDDDMSMDDDF